MLKNVTALTAALALAASAVALPFTTASAADASAGDMAPAADDFGGVKIGTLRCEISGGVGYVFGSAKQINCTFQSVHGGTDSYSGVVRKLGVDLGFTTHGRLVWAVFAPTAGYHHGSLAGRYRGATAEATIGLGAGANVLVGGTTGSVHLQLLSLTGQTGLNLAATGTSMTLNPA
ncbi:MAG: DUF992 domain-containing protein [Rhizobiaceae bacterium]|nr:DUF992 domain-containing protein [Rhizobiaceae bacterium]